MRLSFYTFELLGTYIATVINNVFSNSYFIVRINLLKKLVGSLKLISRSFQI